MKKFKFALGLLFLVALTNSYSDPVRDRTFIEQGAGDSFNYLKIAETAPGLPAGPMAFHHAQRAVLPYLVGLVHQVVPADLYLLFRLTVVLFAVIILFFSVQIFEVLQLSSFQSKILLSVLILNPYAFRYFLTLPAVLNDIGYVLGLAVLLSGLLGGSITKTVGGLLFASLSRQTGLMLIPATLIWIWRPTSDWGKRGFKVQFFLSLVCTCVPVLVYFFTARIARHFSAPSVNISTVTGIFTWFRQDFAWPKLLEFSIRGLLPLSIPLVIIAALTGRQRSSGIQTAGVCNLIFFTMSICAQPWLGGPGVTGQSIARLDVQGFLPLLIATGIMLRDTRTFELPVPKNFLVILTSSLLLGSLHHIYSFIGSFSSDGSFRFFLGYVAVAVVIGAITYFEDPRKCGSFKITEVNL